MSSKVEAVLIAGPTASGKSALAIEVARELGGAVVNADSMQVYRDLRVVTNRPTPDEEAEVPHLLFGTVDGAENFSVGRYLQAAKAVLRDLGRDGRIPILVGGTGLYFKALAEGLSDIPPVPEEVRARVRDDAAGRPAPELHAALAVRDPETARRLRPGDSQRILRALEVLAATGRPLSSFHDGRVPGPLAGRRLARVFLAPDRTALRARIDRRFEAMVREGALDEAAALAARGLDPALPVMRAHGVPGLLAHLRGEVSLEEAIRRGQADTRAYAKRQFTWARHQMDGWTWAAPQEASARLRTMLRG
ncbi:tRNA (adenosine(37)-N6)-dimethylallyltransferase MiaA [Enterovirga aerilata]|uniref:tRNA dimethylallyltransferase n=1 Tax=Enterovirga aerilata TaxID=2730920 RepID=A0A849I5X8_9HYPH|nr:tRNA (adenosine(37)-N6)-dimethylallyltransferase MiaA [Enterovirga sp. DB1703]NNM71447.1 tRNA (adenosine(37)-N6)-dimethylallyltransferase MiaA [Enterovirga sp. DB1703]